jgi:hypothetical protein
MVCDPCHAGDSEREYGGDAEAPSAPPDAVHEGFGGPPGRLSERNALQRRLRAFRHALLRCVAQCHDAALARGQSVSVAAAADGQTPDPRGRRRSGSVRLQPPARVQPAREAKRGSCGEAGGGQGMDLEAERAPPADGGDRGGVMHDPFAVGTVFVRIRWLASLDRSCQALHQVCQWVACRNVRAAHAAQY